MPHISDGQMHAWLDGALPEGGEAREAVRLHLEVCPDCRTRLAEERALRERAGEILAEARPGARDRPAFEELVRRSAESARDASEAGAVSGKRRARWRSLERLAWAATVVLAVGAGWIGRSVLIERGWTDPFHRGGGASTEVGAEAVPEAGQVPPAPDAARARRSAAGEQNRQERVEEPGGEAESREKDIAGAEVVDQAEAATSATREEEVATDPAPGREVRDDEVAPPSEAEQKLFAGRGLEGELDRPAAPESAEAASHGHEPPAGHRHPGPGDPDGCYELGRTFASGIVLPGVIELLPNPVEVRYGPLTSAYELRVPPGFERMTRRLWLPFDRDSVWAHVSTGLSGITIRVGPVDRGYAGTGFLVRDVAGAVPSGPVTLRSVPCPEGEG